VSVRLDGGVKGRFLSACGMTYQITIYCESRVRCSFTCAVPATDVFVVFLDGNNNDKQ
jgi:hypothetical protein